MLNSNKNLIIVDHQNSYFYQQKRKKQRKKWLKLFGLLAFLAALIAIISSFAQATVDENNFQCVKTNVVKPNTPIEF